MATKKNLGKSDKKAEPKKLSKTGKSSETNPLEAVRLRIIQLKKEGKFKTTSKKTKEIKPSKIALWREANPGGIIIVHDRRAVNK